mgnify:CR=1 FL=1
MKTMKLCKLTLALAAAGVCYAPLANAQSNEELLKELRALKERVGQLEKQLSAKPAATVVPAEKQWGMTPEQVQDFNRIAIKTEALEDAQEAFGFKGLKISGYVDPTFIYNDAQRRAGFQLLNPVGTGGYSYDNSYFGMMNLDFQKEMEGGTKLRFTLMPSRGAGAIMAFDSSIVHEASISIPLGELQTRFIAGQIPDWSGYEYVHPTQTKLVTRGLLLDFTVPTAYTGAGLQFVRGKWDSKVLLANVNTTTHVANHRSQALVYRVDHSKGEFSGFGFAGLHGKITNPITSGVSMANLFEVDGYFIRGDWTVQGQLGGGMQKDAAMLRDPETGALRDSQWYGASVLAAYKFMPRWEASARLDYINNAQNGGGLLGFNEPDDRNGLGPEISGYDDAGEAIYSGDGANRYALAMGLSYLYNLNTTFKFEYRYDGADKNVFVDMNDGSYRKYNHLFGASVVVSF